MSILYRGDGSMYQVVQAQQRGDRCYRRKSGWHWHSLDHTCAIVERTVTGPFATQQQATDAGLLHAASAGELA